MSKEYLGIADMMSGLMMVFLLIAIVFMLDVQYSKSEVESQKNLAEQQRDKIELQKKLVEQQRDEIEKQKKAMATVAKVYQDKREKLYHALMAEFKTDLNRWNAEILKDSTIRFKILFESTYGTIKVLFEAGDSELQPRFKTILQEFFPRYIKVLQNYKDDIETIKIEGHTSSEWLGTNDVTTRYLNNVELSQKRALSTLNYCYSNTNISTIQKNWLRQVLRANGLAFAHSVKNSDGSENVEKSRRVEFKVATKSDEKLNEILEISQ